MRIVLEWVDIAFLYGAVLSLYKSSASFGLLKPGIFSLTLPAASAVEAIFNTLYPWHQVNVPLGKPWKTLSVTEKLKIRWQLHQLRTYAWLWSIIAVGMSLAAQGPCVWSSLHAVAVIAAYNCRPK